MDQEKQQSIIAQNTEAIATKAQAYMEPEQFEQHKLILQRFERAKALKQQRSKYYDGMTAEEDYISNENLKNTHLTPKLNVSEVRVNTGTAEKKLDAIKNELLTMHIQHEVRAFDQDDMEVVNLGDDMGDIVSRTNQMEKEDDLMEEVIDEILSQRVVYLRETYQPTTYMRGKETIAICKKEFRSGLQVFPGDWTIPAYLWDTQPYVVDYDRVGYERAEAFLGKYEAFAHVQSNKVQRDIYLGGAYGYRFGELQDGEVEIITYESLPDNEYQIYANGVPMLPPKSPLPSAYPKYSIRAFVAKTMSRNFLAGRPFTAMAKVPQAISNEMLRLFIRKTQQSLEPPMGTPKGGKIFAKSIFNPGTWTQGLRKDDFNKLIDHEGVTAGEMAMYKVVDQEVEKFIGTPNVAQGMQGSREMSATEVVTITKQFLKQLGLTIAALMRIRRDMTEMRIYNVLENYLSPTKRKYDDISKKVEDVYRSFTLDNASFPNNRKGKKVIKLMPRDLTPDEEQKLYEYEESEAEKGNNIRIRFLNADKLKRFAGCWYVATSVQDREGTALDKITFQDQLNQGAAVSKLTGKPMNPDVVTETFERKWKAKDWFNVPAPQAASPMQQPGQENPVQGTANKLLENINAFESENSGSMGEQISQGMSNAGKSASDQVAAQEIAAS